MNANVCRCITFLYKVTSPTTGLVCIIQHVQSFTWIRVNRDHSDNVCIQNVKKRNQKMSRFSASLSCKRPLTKDEILLQHTKTLY